MTTQISSSSVMAGNMILLVSAMWKNVMINVVTPWSSSKLLVH